MNRAYAQMDHAGWVAAQTGQTLSQLGAQVADILGFAFGGIYNAPISHRRQDWTEPRVIEIVVASRGNLCNWDSCSLSLLWIECMRRMVRFEILACSPSHLRMVFTQRSARQGFIAVRLPDVEEMVAMVDEMQGRK